MGASVVEFHISRVSICRDGDRIVDSRGVMGSGDPMTLWLRPGGVECAMASLWSWSSGHFVDEEKILAPGEYILDYGRHPRA